ESGRILILFTDRFAATFDLDFTGQLRQSARWQIAPAVSGHHLQQTDGKGARRAEPRASRRNIRRRRDLYAALDAQRFKRRAKQTVLNLVQPVDLLGLRIG